MTSPRRSGSNRHDRRSATATGWRAPRRALAVVGALTAVTSFAAATNPSGAVVPGRNGKIAFETNRDGNNEIYVMSPDGSLQTNLTNLRKSSDVDPSWAPNGRKLAFSSDRIERGNAEVYVMNADGTGVTQLTNAPGEDRGTSFTSDGSIVFHSTRNAPPDLSHSFDVFIMDDDGDNQTQLTTEGGSAAYACGDSTNGLIVFNSNRPQPDDVDADGDGDLDTDFDIYTMNMDGTDQTNITNTPGFESGPVFSPDCQSISFNSTDTGGSLDIFTMDVDGNNRVNLTNAPALFDAFSAWSPDGQRIVFTTSNTADGNLEIFTMSSADGSAQEQLTFTAFGQADLRADWGTANPQR